MRKGLYLLKTIGFLALFLCTLLTPVERVWAKFHEVSCQGLLDSSLLSKLADHVIKNPFNPLSSSQKRDAIYQQIAPEFTSALQLSGRDMMQFLNMQRIALGRNVAQTGSRWRGELAGLLFLGNGNLTAGLEQNQTHEILSKGITDKHFTISIRLLPNVAKEKSSEVLELARISRATHISILPNFTFRFAFLTIEDAGRFLNRSNQWIREQNTKPQLIPLAYEVSPNVYIEDDFVYMEIENAIKKCSKDIACIQERLKRLMDSTDVAFNKSVTSKLKDYASKTLPKFAPSPTLAQQLGNLDKLPTKARERILHMAASVEHSGELGFDFGIYYKQFESVHPTESPYKEMSTEAETLLHEPENVAIYLAELMRETANLILSSNDTQAKLALSEGRFPRIYLYKILSKWAQEEGFLNIYENTNFLSPEEFRKAILQGLFIDHVFADGNIFHGIDAHVVQVLYVVRNLSKKFGPGAGRRYIAHLMSSNELLKTWNNMLDNNFRVANNFCSPEIVTETYAPYLELH